MIFFYQYSDALCNKSRHKLRHRVAERDDAPKNVAPVSDLASWSAME